MSEFWCAENLVKLRKCAENVKIMLKGLKGMQNSIIFTLFGGVCVCVCVCVKDFPGCCSSSCQCLK